MANQIYKIQFKLFIVLIPVFMGCKNGLFKNDMKENSIENTKSITLPKKSQQTVIKILTNNEFKLNIETLFSSDTLDIIDYKNDFCSSPIILTQKLSFFEKDKLLNHYELPIKVIKKKTITKISLNTLQTPIYKICLVRANNNDYYIVNGSDCCNGSNCPEFTGIYTMQGKIIYEGVSTIKGKVSLKDILLMYKIELNNPLQCIKTDDF
jgi:hypothetical protein